MMKLFGRLYEQHMIKTWMRDCQKGWTLASGFWSPFYFMFREVPSVPELFRYSIDSLTQITNEIRAENPIDLLVGIASTGIPLATGVALNLNLPLACTRKVAGLRTLADLEKNAQVWGEHSLVEGKLQDGMRYILIDDVVTGGTSKELARQQVDLEAEKRGIRLSYCGTAVVVDRGFPGYAGENLGIKAKHRLYDGAAEILEFGGTKKEVAVIRHYLEDPRAFQDEYTRHGLLEEMSRTAH